MDIFDSRYYKYTKIVLSWIGRWSYQTGSKKRIAEVFIIISLVCNIMSQAFYVHSVRYDVDAVLECITPFAVNCASGIVFCVITVNQKQIRKILECIKNDWAVWTSGTELEILKDYAEKGRLFNLIYIVNVYCSIFAVTIQSLIAPALDYINPLNETRPKQPIYGASVPFDKNAHFYWYTAYSVFTGSYNISALMSTESLCAISVMHACGFLQIISFRLKRLSEAIGNGENIKRENLQDFIYKELSSIISIHTYALQLSADIKHCYAPALIVVVGFNCIGLSTTGLQLLKAIEARDSILKFVGYAMGIFFNLYIVMLPPEKLLDSCQEVVVEAYALIWYNIPNKSKKLLLLLLHQSQKPCSLTAGKFYTLNMETLSGLLRTSFSFFTVLFSMQ